MMDREQFYSFMKYSVQDLLNERGVEGSVQIELFLYCIEIVFKFLLIWFVGV